jgi:hypothetical protein
MLKTKLPQKVVRDIITDAVKIEKAFVCEALPGKKNFFFIFLC